MDNEHNLFQATPSDPSMSPLSIRTWTSETDSVGSIPRIKLTCEGDNACFSENNRTIFLSRSLEFKYSLCPGISAN